MAATFKQVTIDAAVREMLELPVGSRKAARDAIAVTVLDQAGRLASGWCRAGGDSGLAQRNDVEAEGVLYYLEALNDLAEGRVPAGVRNYDAYLQTRVTFQISAWMRSSSFTGVTGASGVTQRASRAAHFIQRFETAHRREPSAAELVEVFNTEMTGRRGNAAKQGALIGITEAKAALERHSFAPPRMSRA